MIRLPGSFTTSERQPYTHDAPSRRPLRSRGRLLISFIGRRIVTAGNLQRIHRRGQIDCKNRSFSGGNYEISDAWSRYTNHFGRSSPWAAAGFRWSRGTCGLTATSSRSREARNRRKPRICFLRDRLRRLARLHPPLPSRDGEARPARQPRLTLFRRDARDPADIIADQDILYVGGGNTANLLAIWRLHGVDRAITQAWRDGVILAGLSAGMICWFQSSVTDSFGPLRELSDGLGLLPGSACPHYDGEKNRRPTFHRLIREKKLPPGVAADDGAAIHFIGDKIHRCVASRRHAKAYRVALVKGKVVEQELPTDFLP